jgi:hypothetical protein
MDCDAVRDALRGGPGALASGVAEHVARCSGCAALAGGVAAALAAPAPVSGLPPFGAIERDLAAERGVAAWLRGRSTTARGAMLAGTGAAVVLVVLFASRRPDLGALPLARIVSDAATLAIAALVLGALAVRPLQRPSPRPGVIGLGLGAGLLAIAIAGLLPPMHAHAAPLGAAFGRATLMCFAYATACAVPVLVIAAWISRHGETPWRPRALSAVLAACIGALSVWLHCPFTDPAHLLAGHSTVAVPLVVLAALALRPLRARA